ncbi:MAG: TatD family hydrolase [Patescibacteria group bacterium]
MIDTHAHIQEKEYKADQDQVISRAQLSGVEQVFCIGSTMSNSYDAVALAKRYPDFVLPSVGLHPHDMDEGDTKKTTPQLLKELEVLLVENDNIVAIGECGLDFNVREGQELPRSIQDQKELFVGQINLAKKYQLPIFFHVNKAYDEVLDILLEEDLGDIPGIFHFYTGGKKRIQKILNSGNLYFGVGGAVTYDQGIMEVVKELPLDRIVLETDCPYLAPVPHRGERNEPAWISFVVDKIADLKQVPVNEVIYQTTINAKSILAGK